MPTENRPSNTEMVSVPKELLQRIDRMYADGMSIFGECEELRAILAKPAEQHHGEPVAVTTIGPDDLVAIDLLVDSIEAGTKLYTHADPGEVERLRANAGKHKLAMDAACGEIDALRAQLREQDALLDEAYQRDIGTPLKRKIRALSASAEPISGTPLAQLTEAKLLLHTASTSLARWLGQDDDPRKQIIAFLEGSAEPSAPIAWHVGGNGYDRVCFDMPTDLPGQPCIQPIHGLRQLIDLLKRYDLRDEDLLPDERAHGIPGTSFQRLNALANQGE
ncbi:hypothetical protein IRZ70_11470 [Pseudomonas monteilii]|nr:hypothetical protein [Pseudomonas monteilii]